MKVVIENFDENYAFCRRDDQILIQILLKFLKKVEIGDVIHLPETRELN